MILIGHDHKVTIPQALGVSVGLCAMGQVQLSVQKV